MPTHYRGTTDEVRALNTIIKFTRAAESLNGWASNLVASYGLTGSQFGALEVLYHLGPMCQGELGSKILKSSGNMTMVVDNLEKQGFVRRERDEEDRRQIMVHLTDKGRDLIARIFPIHAQKIAEVMSILTPDEQHELARLSKILGTQARE